MGGGMSVSSHDRQPATRARSAMAPTSPRSGISMPMWANGALIGWRLPLSRHNMTSTRTNGFSTCLAWLSQALWPSSSSRRSRRTRGVNSSYHAIDASRSLDGRAMWVQRGWVNMLAPLSGLLPRVRYFYPGARQQGALHVSSCAAQLVLVDSGASTVAHDDAAVDHDVAHRPAVGAPHEVEGGITGRRPWERGAVVHDEVGGLARLQ